MTHSSSRPGFTLIELLLVIGIIAILATIVVVAVNPTKEMGNGRNIRRRQDVNMLLDKVLQYSLDHNGKLPGAIPQGEENAMEICAATAAAMGDCGEFLDLSALSGSYLKVMPSDPRATGDGTDYFIYQDEQKRITVYAGTTEGDPAPKISATR